MPNRHNRRAFISPAEARKRRQDRAGLALIAGCALAFAGMFTAAYQADKARGISLSESLANAGFGSRAEVTSKRLESASHNGEAAGQRKPARIEGVDGSAEIMGAIAGELRKAGCQVRVDSPSSYEVESC